MSIFEKAFEKASKSRAGEQQDASELSTTDELLELSEYLDEEGTLATPADRPGGIDPGVDSISPEPGTGIETPLYEGSGMQVQVDLNGLKAAGLVDPQSNHVNRTTEEFRRIKRPLLMHAKGQGATVVENANMIMVTSALAGEGKTFTSINLAMSIAIEMDKTVLLVDADVAKPDVTARLGVEAEKGLIDVLLDDSLTLTDVLLRTDIPKLTLLPSGSRHVHSTELLASDRMHQLTLELSSRYPDRIVIFDSPPLLLTSEARVLASLMGQIVLVVEESRTPQYAVKEAIQALDSNEIVGVVINKGTQGAKGDYYYRGYGYYPYGQR